MGGAVKFPTTGDYARWARKAKPRRMPKPRITSAMPRKEYFDLPVTIETGAVYLLTPHDVGRLRSLEARNRLRVKQAKGDWPEAVIEPVDFIAVCIKQEWRCCICGSLMHPGLKGKHKRSISVEHSPALSVCNEHSARTVHAAHVICNVGKSHKQDTPRAAKIVRVRHAEEKHAAKMRMKATMTPAARRREERAEKIARGNRSIAAPKVSPLSKHSPHYRPRSWGKKIERKA